MQIKKRQGGKNSAEWGSPSRRRWSTLDCSPVGGEGEEDDDDDGCGGGDVDGGDDQ